MQYCVVVLQYYCVVVLQYYSDVQYCVAVGPTLHSVTMQGTLSTLSLTQSYGSSDSSISVTPSSPSVISTLGILTNHGTGYKSRLAVM